MNTVSASEMQAHFSEYLQKSQSEGPIVIVQNGKAIGVLLAPHDDEDAERLVLGRSPRFQALLDKSRQSIASGAGLSRDEFWQAVEKRAAEKERTTEN